MLPSPPTTLLRSLAVLAVFAFVLGVETLPTAQGPATIWVADDVATPDLLVNGYAATPRVNGFGFGLDGAPMVGWTQTEGASGSNETYWSEKLADGWLKREWGPQGFWGSGPSGGAHEFAVGNDGRPYLFMVGGNPNSLTYHTYRADLRAYADGEPGYLVWTGEHVGNHQECVYVRYKVDGGPGQDWPYRVTARGHCNNSGPFRFEGQPLTADQLVRGFDLAMGADGRAHIAYITSAGHVMYMRPGEAPVQVATVNYYSDDVAIQPGPNGTVHIVARGYGFTGELDRGMLGYFRSSDDGATWTHVDNADASRVTYGLSLQLDPSGAPAVAYWRYGQGLYYTSRASGTWVESRVVNPGWSGVEWVKPPYLRFDAAGVPHIAYYDWSANRIRLSSPAPAGVEPPVDLHVQGNASPNPTVAGTQVTFTVTMGNASTREASGVRVQATLPPGTTANTITPAPLTNSGGVLTFNAWHIRGGGTGQDRLPAGATGTITFNVSGLTTGISELPVVVTSTEDDADLADNSIVVTARINAAMCALPVSGRTAWWPGDGTPLNYGSGPAYHATPVGGVSYGPGAVGQAFVLDGATGYLKVPNGWPEYYWPGTGATSVAAWFATEAGAATQVIASMDDMAHAPCCGSPQGHAAWYLYVENGVVKASMRQSAYGSAGVAISGTTPVADGQFHHAALVIDIPALQARLFVNGALEASAPLASGWTMSWGDYEAEELVIGASQVTWGTGYRYFFNGAIDDVALYKRVLTATEIANAAAGARLVECGAVPVSLASPGDWTSEEGDAITLPLDWSAGDGRVARFEAVGLPAGLSIGMHDGVITGTIAEGAAGTYPVTVRLSDSLTEAIVSFLWTVTVPPLPVLTLHAGAGAILTVVETGAQCIGGEADAMFDRTCALEVPAGIYTVQGTTPLSMSRLRWHWTLAAPYEVPAEPDRVTVQVVDATEVGGALLGSFVVERQWEDGGGPGTVTSSLPPYLDGQPGFGCGAGAKCVGQALLGTTVTLTAGRAGDFIFASWGGGCAGADPVCQLFIDPLTYVRELSMPLVDAFFTVYQPPHLANPGGQQSYEGETISLPLTWSAGDARNVAFMATGLPPGLVIGESTGVISGTLTMESSGTFQVTVTISDGERDWPTTFWWVVDDMNQDPVAVDDALEIDRNTPTFTIPAAQLLANDSDPDGDELFIIAVGGSTNGRARLRDDGNVDFTVDPVFHGTASFVYDASDGRGGSASANVVITVVLVNEAPIAVDDVAVTLGWPVTINVLANDSDPDGDPLTITGIAVPPAKGTAVIEGASIRYTPSRASDAPLENAYSGADAFAYTISDGLGGEASATVTITTPPSHLTDISVTFLGVQREADSGLSSLRYRVRNDGPATEPLVQFQAVTDWSVWVVRGAQTVEPSPGVSCPLPDGDTGAWCTIANLAPGAEVTFRVHVMPLRDNAPRTFRTGANAFGELTDTDYTNNTAEAEVTIPLVMADLAVGLSASHPSYHVGDPVGFTAQVRNDGPEASVLTRLNLMLDGAGVSSDAECRPSASVDGRQPWSCYVPSLQPGQTWTVTFEQVSSTAGTRLNTATVGDWYDIFWMTDPVAANNSVEVVTEASLNRAPVAVDDAVELLGPGAVTIDVLANDSDADGDTLTITGIAEAPLKGTATVEGTAIRYVTNAGLGADTFSGVDSFVYTISDGQGGTASATVTITTPPEELVDVSVAIVGVERDPDTGIPYVRMRVRNEGPATEPMVRFTAFSEAWLGMMRAVRLLEPAPGAACDPSPDLPTPSGIGAGSCTIADMAPGAEVSIAVLVHPWTTSTPRTIPLYAYVRPDRIDSDYSNNLVNQEVTIPLSVSDLSVSLSASPTYRVGEPVTFTVEVRNAGPDVSVSWPLTLTLDGTGTSPSGCLAGLVTDGRQAWNCRVPSLEPGAAWTTTFEHVSAVAGTRTSTAQLYLTLSEVFYTTDPDVANNLVSVDTIASENRAPVAVDDNLETDEDTPLEIAPALLLANDTDADSDTLTLVAVSDTAVNGTVAFEAGVIVFTPAQDVHGAASFQYRIDDGYDGTAWGTVHITVHSVNDDPVVPDQLVDAVAGVPITIAIGATDVDGDKLAYVIRTAPANGTADLVDDAIVYTANAKFDGTDTVEVQVSDGVGGVAIGRIRIQVTSTNDPPVFESVTVEVPANGTVTVTLAAVDPDDDQVSYRIRVEPEFGTATLAGDQLTYTPQADFEGSEKVVLEADDGRGGTTEAQVTFVVTPVNQPPFVGVPLPDLTLLEDALPFVVDLDGVFKDSEDVDGLTYTASSDNPGVVTVSVNGLAGTVTLTLVPDAFGVATITVVASDGEFEVADAFVVTVREVNDPPRLDQPANVRVVGGTEVVVPLTGLAAGPANEAYQFGSLEVWVSSSDAAVTGAPVVTVNGGVVFTPPVRTSVGVATVSVVAFDDHGREDGGWDTTTRTFTVTVLPPPPTVVTPPAQFSATGSVVALPVSYTAYPGAELFFTAVGLPPGLSIDADTGVISGTAGSGTGTYAVTVILYDGLATASLSFTWQIVPPPTLTVPERQSSRPGAVVSVPLTYTAYAGATLRFTAAGLPPGLAIDQGTGVISGTVGTQPRVYNVTVTLHDGVSSVSGTFEWQVEAGTIEILVEEHITVTDAVEVSPAVMIVIDESITVTDEVGVLPPVLIVIDEVITVTDAVDIQVTNTTAGSNTTVVFGGGGSKSVILRFSNVAVSGLTTVEPVNDAPPLPSGYVMAEPPLIYDISTTAEYTGAVEVCVEYDPQAYKTSDQRLFHHNGSSWTDTTTSNRRDTSTVCGTTTKFSPFAVVEPVPLDGRITGNGRVETADAVHEFHLRVSEGVRARPNDRLRYEVTTTESVTSPGKSAGKGKAAPPVVKKVTRTDRFEATAIQSIRFHDDPGFNSGRTRRGPQAGTVVDSVSVSGVGTWNGAAGYTFEARAEDQGEPGRGRDVFAMTVRSPQGVVVAVVDGVIAAGNIQSHKVDRR